MAPACAPDIARFFGMSAGAAASAIIVAFYSLAFLVEAPLLAWTEKFSARWVSSAALGVLSIAAILAALVPRGFFLFAALALYGPASGVSLAIAEGTLVEARPHERERTMARFTLAASAGDLAVPVLLGLLGLFGYGWRAGFFIGGVIGAVLAITHASSRYLDVPISIESDDDDGADELDTEKPTLRKALWAALSNRPLLAWSFAGSVTSLLDEVLVAFAAIHLDVLGASMALRSWALGAWVVGGIAGVALLERTIMRFDPRKVLIGACAMTTVALLVFAGSRSPTIATIALFFVGASGATLHPLTKARAYAAFAGRPAIVNAVASALVLFDIGAPIAIGALVATFGSSAGILAIGLSPIAVAFIAWRMRQARSD